MGWTYSKTDENMEDIDLLYSDSFAYWIEVILLQEDICIQILYTNITVFVTRTCIILYILHMLETSPYFYKFKYY